MDYELHIICGVNPKVTEGSMAYLFKKRFKYEYFHINFWSTPKGSNPASTPMVLFFAECSNDDKSEEERPSLCFPVLASSIDDSMLTSHLFLDTQKAPNCTYAILRSSIQKVACATN